MVDDFKGRGGSPWGSPSGGGNGSGRKGPTPPDIDEIIRSFQLQKDLYLHCCLKMNAYKICEESDFCFA